MVRDRVTADITPTGVCPGVEIRFAFNIPNFGDFADPRVFARCAKLLRMPAGTA